jgi:hypothetical protein
VVSLNKHAALAKLVARGAKKEPKSGPGKSADSKAKARPVSEEAVLPTPNGEKVGDEVKAEPQSEAVDAAPDLASDVKTLEPKTQTEQTEQGTSANSQLTPPPKSRWGIYWRRGLIVALSALATGMGTELAGKFYDQAKSHVVEVFVGHNWTSYAREPNPVCDAYELSEKDKALKDVGIYYYRWSVGRLTGNWAGIIRKGKNPDASSWLVGTDRGDHTVLTYSSTRETDGIGAYVLTRRDGGHAGEDYFVGYWIGRECSVRGHPYIKCPMAVVRSSVDQKDGEQLVPRGDCELSDPPLVDK